MAKAPNTRTEDLDENPFDFLIPESTQEIVAGDVLESDGMPNLGILSRKDVRRRQILATKRERVAEVVDRLPEPGETFHVVVNGIFDHFDFVPRVVELMGPVDQFYGSTWTMNRQNALDLLQMFDEGGLKAIALLTGLYFKRRETAVYATVLEGLQARGQRYIAFANHAKVSMFVQQESETYIVIEGSANYTANPRLENFTITNDPQVCDLHRTWMEEILP